MMRLYPFTKDRLNTEHLNDTRIFLSSFVSQQEAIFEKCDRVGQWTNDSNLMKYHIHLI